MTISALNIESECGLLQSVIAYDAEHNAVTLTEENWRDGLEPEDIAQHPEYGPVDRPETIKQLRAFHALLRKHSVQIVEPVAQDGACWQMFCRDPAFVIDDTLYLANMRDEERYAEVNGIAETRLGIANIIDLRADGVIIEGGDIMVQNKNTILAGTGQITNAQGIDVLRSHLRDRDVITVPHTALHLDCCFAPLPNGEALYSQKHLPPSSIETIRDATGITNWKPIDATEDTLHLASNMLWLNPRTVVSSTSAPLTNTSLRQRGYTVEEAQVDQLIRIGGSVRCALCPLLRGT